MRLPHRFVTPKINNKRDSFFLIPSLALSESFFKSSDIKAANPLDSKNPDATIPDAARFGPLLNDNAPVAVAAAAPTASPPSQTDVSPGKIISLFFFLAFSIAFIYPGATLIGW